MAWDKHTLLADLGLAPHGGRSYRGLEIKIDKGEIDPRSHGGISVISKSKLDDDGNLVSLDLHYWVIFPDGRYQEQSLFQLETEKLDDGNLDVKDIYVLGRKVSHYSETNIENTLEAIRRIHISLRDTGKQLPHVAQIFKECGLENIIGESLPLPGFHPEHRIYFPASRNFNIHAAGEENIRLVIPRESFNPLRGLRKNSLDRDHSYIGRDFLRIRGVPNHTGKRFEVSSTLIKQGEKDRILQVTQGPVETMEKGEPRRVIAKAVWEKEKARGKNQYKESVVRISELSLFGQNILRRGFRAAMGAIAVLNDTHADMLNGDYPNMQDYLSMHGLLDVVETTSLPPSQEGRFVLTSMGGNNIREIYPGVGENIGGNCKAVETQWLDARTGETKKTGAILDVGMFLLRQRTEWTSAAPDLVEKLNYCRHIFISHHHIDHIDGLVPYIKRRLITASHTLYMTPEVSEMLDDKLTKMGIKKHDPRRPKIEFLEGTGKIDIYDEGGVKRMSVVYSADAVSHTARDTPFLAYGRDGDTILGSYLYMGDARYDEEWLEIRKSEFWDPVAFMLEQEPGLNPDHLKPTFVEFDGTSVKRKGRGATEKDVEGNLVNLVGGPTNPGGCFAHKHVGVVNIGTSDSRRGTILNVANLCGRNGVPIGAAVEKLFQISNKFGVNRYLLPSPASGTYTGIEDYLLWHAEKNNLTPIEFMGRTSKTAKRWFANDPPGTILAVMSGSQGNVIEFESTAYKLSEGRSFFDADPKKSKSALPANLKDWVIIFSQSAIPGNAADQKALIKRLAARGATVLESFDDNIRIHNPKDSEERLRSMLENRNQPEKDSEMVSAAIEPPDADGSIVVKNMPIHASGHAREGDVIEWLKIINAKKYGFCHSDDREGIQAAYELLERQGKQHPGRFFENFEEIQITTEEVLPIGKILPSVVMIKEIAEDGKHYNKRQEATRVVNFNGSTPFNQLGLRGSLKGPFQTHFGTEDVETVKKRGNKKREFQENKHDVIAKPHRPYRGIIVPAAMPEPDWKGVEFNVPEAA